MHDSSGRRTNRGARKSHLWHLSHAIFALAVALLGASDSLAADTRCGVDTDLSGAVDVLCPSPDQDGDGYTSDGTLGRAGTTYTDCDDTNYYVRPGVSYKGSCSAGEFKTCNTNGTTTGCAALSTFTCHSGSGATYWIDDDETNCAGTGSITDEWDWRCTSDTGMGSYHAPVAGDCYVHRAGTYSSMWSGNTRHIYLTNKDGTSSDNITFIAAPGETWWEAGVGNGVVIDGASTAPTSVDTIKLSESDYINVIGFEITSGVSGYNTVGIHYEGPLTGGKAYNNYIHDLHGECGSLNCAGISIRSSADSVSATHNMFDNIYEIGDSENQNTSDIVVMDCDLFKVNFNVCKSTDGNGYGIKIKHGDLGATGGEILQNIVTTRVDFPGIACGGVPHTDIKYNYLYDMDNGGIEVKDLGANTDDFTDIYVAYNTIINTNTFCFAFNPDNTDATAGTPSVNAELNICISDHSGTWPSSGDGSSDVRVNHYGSDALYTDHISGNKMVIENNCIYKSTGDAFQGTIFGNNDSTVNGTVYNSWSAWQTAGWDTGGANENPTLDSYGRATSTNCSDAGWLLTSEGGTPTAQGSGRGQRIKRGRLLK